MAIAAYIFWSPTVELEEISHTAKVDKWNKAVNKIQNQGRNIASIDSKNGLDPRIKTIATFDSKKRQLHRMISSKSKIQLDPGEVVKPDFKISGMGYRFVDHFYAIPNTEENRKKFPDGFVKLNYLLVESQIALQDGLGVVENSETGNYGIFTGILKVKLSDIRYADDIIPHSDYLISNIYEHINIVHYKIDNIGLAVKTQSLLETNPYVKRVGLEILEYERSQR